MKSGSGKRALMPSQLDAVGVDALVAAGARPLEREHHGARPLSIGV